MPRLAPGRLVRAFSGVGCCPSGANPACVQLYDTVQNFDALIDGLSGINSAFPDWHWKVLEVLFDGKLITARYADTGTHMGLFQGIEHREPAEPSATGGSGRRSPLKPRFQQGRIVRRAGARLHAAVADAPRVRSGTILNAAGLRIAVKHSELRVRAADMLMPFS
jgi:hypothetical protein